MESSSWNREVEELVVFVFVVVAVGFTDAAEEEELIVIADCGETGFSIPILLVVGSDLTFEVCFVVVVDVFRWFCLVVGDVVVVEVFCFFAGTVLLLLVMVVSLVVGIGVFVDVAFLANCRFDPSAFDVSFSCR